MTLAERANKVWEKELMDEAQGWIEWNGGECPVAEGTRVDYKLRGNPDTSVADASFPAENLQWNHENEPWDIVAYRLVDAPGASTEPESALTHQPTGTHYRDATIQPVQFIEANKLGFLEGCIVKRATRHNHPTGKGAEDIRKIIHEAQLLLQLRYGEVA
jgi:hypothetical protein